MYKYLFGPVPSRRLGSSLGVDLVIHKTCSMDCVYCECGATTNLTIERAEYVPTCDVIKELDDYLSTKPQLNYITFSGAGEPTLHSGLGEIVMFLKDKFPIYKVCLLTNSSLINNDQLRKEILDIDLIIPSLDAVTADAFRSINKPADTIEIADIVSGLCKFRNESPATMWLEVFVIPDLNDDIDSILALKKAVEKIDPDKIQINTIDRPGTKNWVTTPSEEKVAAFMDALKEYAPVEVVSKFKYKNIPLKSDVSEEILMRKIIEMIKRRPCTAEDMTFSLSVNLEDITIILNRLIGLKKIDSEKQDRGTFYTTSNKD